jgi:hypothetical protein
LFRGAKGGDFNDLKRGLHTLHPSGPD